ncbi:hypothetical protein GCM10017771_93820 [Streptomyces capitiformicae]|uniref:Uncharacterized protein n=1 Tax=Streptomyces capitiformicae TaxID=2014920 RepID=A0A918ZTX2_9ACTN|nr:hypothetical protein GCM10017771_93820 [Streptomyces capitiformicae]
MPVIAQLVQADEDTVRGVIHRFNEIGLACLDPTSISDGRKAAPSHAACSRKSASAAIPVARVS